MFKKSLKFLATGLAAMGLLFAASGCFSPQAPREPTPPQTEARAAASVSPAVEKAVPSCESVPLISGAAGLYSSGGPVSIAAAAGEEPAPNPVCGLAASDAPSPELRQPEEDETTEVSIRQAEEISQAGSADSACATRLILRKLTCTQEQPAGQKELTAPDEIGRLLEFLASVPKTSPAEYDNAPGALFNVQNPEAGYSVTLYRGNILCYDGGYYQVGPDFADGLLALYNSADAPATEISF